MERLTEIPRSCVILLDLSMPRIDAWESLWRRSVDYKYSYDRFVGLRPAGRKAQLAEPIDLTGCWRCSISIAEPF
jgi:hypothetical protein